MSIRPIALVTGASRGIGREIAIELARRGYDLVLAARSEADLNETADAVRKVGGATHVFAADLASPDGPDRLWQAVETSGANVELLVNNAGFGDLAPVSEADGEKLSAMVDLNVRALVRLSRLAAPGMAERGKGAILNVASTAAFMPGPGMAVYYASKAFVKSFSEALRFELKGSGVKVTALCPGAVATGFQQAADMEGAGLFKVMPVMKPETVARYGVKALMKNRAVAVPGLMNKLSALSAGLTPRPVLLRIVRSLHRTS